MNKRIIAWFAAALFIGGFLSLFASASPDGFAKAGKEVGYIEKAASYLKSPLPSYSFPGSDSWLSASASGLIGVILTFVCFFLLGKWMARRKR